MKFSSAHRLSNNVFKRQNILKGMYSFCEHLKYTVVFNFYILERIYGNKSKNIFTDE
jgi:hypothetical protein